MKSVKILRPNLTQVRRDGALEFANQSGSHDAERSTRFHKMSQVIQVQVVRTEIWKRVHAYNGVEELTSERQTPSIHMQWEYAAIHSGITESPAVFRRAYPEVSGPNLDAEF